MHPLMGRLASAQHWPNTEAMASPLPAASPPEIPFAPWHRPGPLPARGLPAPRSVARWPRTDTPSSHACGAQVAALPMVAESAASLAMAASLDRFPHRAPGGASRSARTPPQDPVHFSALFHREIRQIVEAGIPEPIDVQPCLARWEGFERAISELGNDALLLEASERIVHVEVDLDVEGVLEILLDGLVHLAQVAYVHPLLRKHAIEEHLLFDVFLRCSVGE